jgi:CRP-like cAMP-binding protein
MVRRIKILGTMTDDQLEVFCKYLQLEEIAQWKVLVTQGEIGDCMYMILQGELRVRVMIAEKETILTTLGPGDFFGDISLFDHGPRSADVVANTDSALLKLRSADFQKLCTEAPDVAAPLLVAVGRTLTARIRADNKRLGDSIRWSRAGG